jgi:hypothetical protein
MAGTADPTLEFLQAFDDPSKWVIKRNVPIFKPHVKRDKDGNFLYEVTEADLPEILANLQAAKQNLRVVPKVTLGHVHLQKDWPEQQQAPIVGYVPEARVGRFGANPAILGDIYVRKEDDAKVKGYPFRSADYYPQTKEITGVAMLIRDPELDLGMVSLHRDKGPCYQYALENDAMPDPTEKPTMPVAGPEDEQHYANFCKYMAGKHPKLAQLMGAAMGPTNGAMPGQAAGGKPAPDEEARYAQMAKTLRAKNPRLAQLMEPEEDVNIDINDPNKPDQDLRGKNQEGQASAIGAKLGPDPERSAESRAASRHQDQRTISPEQYHRLEQTVAQMQLEVVREKYRGSLVQLQAVGYEFDIDREIARMPGTPEGRTERVQDIKLYHKQAPVDPVQYAMLNVPVFVGESTTAQASDKVKKARDEKVMQYLRTHPGSTVDVAEAACA